MKIKQDNLLNTQSTLFKSRVPVPWKRLSSLSWILNASLTDQWLLFSRRLHLEPFPASISHLIKVRAVRHGSHHLWREIAILQGWECESSPPPQGISTSNFPSLRTFFLLTLISFGFFCLFVVFVFNIPFLTTEQCRSLFTEGKILYSSSTVHCSQK